MPYFSEEMTSECARGTFFKLFDQYYNDEISLDEMCKILREYEDVGEKIVQREMDVFNKELAGTGSDLPDS